GATRTHPAVPSGGSGAGGERLRRPRLRGGARRLLRRSARAHDQEPPDRLARRGVQRRGNPGARPARPAGAVPLRRRRPPAGQRRGGEPCRRRLADRGDEARRRSARRPAAGLPGRAAAAERAGRARGRARPHRCRFGARRRTAVPRGGRGLQRADGGLGMRTLPFDAGGIHFVGIGGIGMSGIAEVLHSLGHRVQGSDIAENANIERLRRLGIPVAIGHRAANLGECGVVVMSSAIKPDNPEIEAARGARVPVVCRAEMLGELMRLKWAIAVAGTHGKTTTTSLIAALLDAAKLDPTVINGGIINADGTNARHGKGDWMVVEADESDGTFVRLPASAAVVTNIDPEHMEFYGDFDAVRAAFQSFVENIPFYGFATLCIDHPEVQALFGRITDRRLISYGFSPQADVRALDPSFDLRGAEFDVELRDRTSGLVEHRIERLRLPMPGAHNVQNALAAIAVAR